MKQIIKIRQLAIGNRQFAVGGYAKLRFIQFESDFALRFSARGPYRKPRP
jgi:hypothetical protein